MPTGVIHQRICEINVWNLFKYDNKYTLKRRWHCSGVFIVNFEQISHICSVSIVEIEQENADWI